MKTTNKNIQEITFSVADVELGKDRLKELPYKTALEKALGTPVEGYPILKERFFPVPLQHNHALIGAIGVAFNCHYPLVLSPDMFWLLIAQGFAKHILLHSEEMRDTFVNHEGQQTLEVYVNGFEKGRNNHWERVFPQFTEQVQANIKADLLHTLVPEFSTTTPIEKAAFELCMMEAMKDYFKYVVVSICGIPSITLQGSVADWEKMIQHTKQLKGYGLDNWIDRLLPLLAEIKETANGKIDQEFWESIYKYQGGSGGPHITGWINLFFPYLEMEDCTEEDINRLNEYTTVVKQVVITSEQEEEDDETYKVVYKNPSLGEDNEMGGSITPDEFPSSITNTPFIWNDQNGTSRKNHNMEFVAGLVGCTQDAETLAIRPEISWAVREA